MAEKFGDGCYYDFKESDDNDDYTHSHDGYYYHKDWFIDEDEIVKPIIKLDEEDFIL